MTLSTSIRNQLPGTVAAVTSGAAMATVRIRLDGGQELTSAVTAEAVAELGIAAGSRITALVKSTEVALAIGPVEGLSIRNRLAGTVSAVTLGPAMATVKIAAGSVELTAAVTSDAVTDLALTTGTPVVALMKSTEVSLVTG